MTDKFRSNSEAVQYLIDEVTPEARRKRVDQAIDEHFKDKQHRDGRGRKSDELKKARKALGHLKSMRSWSKDEDCDLNYRRRIRDFLKHVDHGQSWAVTMEECSKARGLVNKSGRRRNEARPIGSGKHISLIEGYIAVPLNSVRELRAAGRRGENCLGDPEMDYLDNLKTLSHAYFEITDPNKVPIAYVEVEKSTRGMVNLEGPRGSSCEVPPDVLMSFCNLVHVKGDDCGAMVRVGAMSLARNAECGLRDPMRTACHFDIWWQPSEVVLRDQKNATNPTWSRFVWEFDSWYADGWEWIASDGSEMNEENLCYLLRDRDDELAEVFQMARPDPEEETSIEVTQCQRRNGRRRRRQGRFRYV